MESSINYAKDANKCSSTNTSMKLFGTLNNPPFVLPYNADKSISSTTTDVVHPCGLEVINILCIQSAKKP